MSGKAAGSSLSRTQSRCCLGVRNRTRRAQLGERAGKVCSRKGLGLAREEKDG